MNSIKQPISKKISCQTVLVSHYQEGTLQSGSRYFTLINDAVYSWHCLLETSPYLWPTRNIQNGR